MFQPHFHAHTNFLLGHNSNASSFPSFHLKCSNQEFYLGEGRETAYWPSMETSLFSYVSLNGAVRDGLLNPIIHTGKIISIEIWICFPTMGRKITQLTSALLSLRTTSGSEMCYPTSRNHSVVESYYIYLLTLFIAWLFIDTIIIILTLLIAQSQHMQGYFY